MPLYAAPIAATPAAPSAGVVELLRLLCEPKQWGGTYAAMRHDGCISRCCDCDREIEDEDHAPDCPIRKDWDAAARIKMLATQLQAALAQPAPASAQGKPMEVTQCPNCKGTRTPSPVDPDWRGRCECAAPVQQDAPAPSMVGDATCDAVVEAVRAVIGGQSASSDATDWARKVQRCRDGIRAAISGQKPAEGEMPK